MENLHKPYGPYERLFKRPLDFILALSAIIVLSPVLLVLIITGLIAMKGNPFFMQRRPGKIDKGTGKEKNFALIKFRTMSNAKDKNKKFLPDEQRLNAYGRFLRVTSCDELPELINIVKGDMAIVGPRPLLVDYLPYYTVEEHHRHDIRPGLTGLAQINGRNNLEWGTRLKLDLEYVNKVTFIGDFEIVVKTIRNVICRKDVVTAGHYKMKRLDLERAEQNDYQKAAD